MANNVWRMVVPDNQVMVLNDVRFTSKVAETKIYDSNSPESGPRIVRTYGDMHVSATVVSHDE